METEKIVIFVFAIYLISMIGYSSFRSWKISKWPCVTGKLLKADVEITSLIDHGGAWEDVKYEYEVDGMKYVGSRLSPLVVRGQVRRRIKKQLAKIQYVSDDQIKVFYNERNPSKSYLVKETWLNIFG